MRDKSRPFDFLSAHNCTRIHFILVCPERGPTPGTPKFWGSGQGGSVLTSLEPDPGSRPGDPEAGPKVLGVGAGRG